VKIGRRILEISQIRRLRGLISGGMVAILAEVLTARSQQ